MRPGPSPRILAIGVTKVAAVLVAISLLGVVADVLVFALVLPLGPWRLFGVLPLIGGVLLEAAGTRAFWTRGRGTPHPAGAPRQLVTAGPYAHSRNPLYIARLMVLAGVGVLLDSGGILLLTLLLFLGIEFWLLPHEEARLRGRYGQEYVDYCRAVPRWIVLAPGGRSRVGRTRT